MAWSVETIEKEWLGASIGVLALAPEEVLATFSKVEAVLGHAWIEEAHQGGAFKGTMPLLHVVSMGQRLAALDRVPYAHKLVEKILRKDVSADAELTAIYLVRRTQRFRLNWSRRSACAKPISERDTREASGCGIVAGPGEPHRHIAVRIAHAVRPLPDWIERNLKDAGADFERFIRPAARPTA